VAPTVNRLLLTPRNFPFGIFQGVGPVHRTETDMGVYMSKRSLPKQKGFLVRTNSRGYAIGKSHLWAGSDTVCRMWSTGLDQSNKTYKVTSEPMTQLCSLCHPERYNMDLWILESVALGAAQPYTLFNEQG
jgi:hypothetical protein